MEKKKTKPKYGVLQNCVYVLKSIWVHDKSVLPAMLIMAMAGVVLPFYGIYLPKIIISLIESRAGISEFIQMIGLMTSGAAAVCFISGYFGTYRYWRTHRLRNNMIWEVFVSSIHCGYDNLESSVGQTKYQKSIYSLWSGDLSGVNRIIPAMLELVTAFLGFALYTGILSGLNILIIGLLILSSAVNYFFIRYAQKYAYSRKEETADILKKVYYIQRKAGESTSGKDVRIYGMKKWFMGLHHQFLLQLSGIDKQVGSKNLLSAVVSALLVVLRDGLAIIYLIFQVTGQRIGIGDFVFYSGAIIGFSNWITQIVSQAGVVTQASLQICETREFFDFVHEEEIDEPVSVPDAKLYTIEFKNVCFRYGENENDTVSDLNLTIKGGEKVAVVGVNGAGKTTLVKLLCGFYRPDRGQILFNGTDIGKVNKEELFDLFSVVFQDIFIAPFTVAENVALSISAQIDEDKVNMALKKAGLYEYVHSLPQGIHSPMTKIRYDDGIILSGGQQQKLLLARALYKNAPILILDEPSAALDPIAESGLYEQYNELTLGKTSVYISHRLSSTRFCDRILFVSGGRIAEQGSHNELMLLQGEYAKMYEIQSHYYQDQPEEGGDFIEKV